MSSNPAESRRAPSRAGLDSLPIIKPTNPPAALNEAELDAIKRFFWWDGWLIEGRMAAQMETVHQLYRLGYCFPAVKAFALPRWKLTELGMAVKALLS